MVKRHSLLEPLVIITIIMIALVIGYSLGVYLKHKLNTKSCINDEVRESIHKLNDAFTIIIEVKHYRNGKLINEYRKVGDPLTRNLIGIILNTFFAQRYTDSVIPVKATDGYEWSDFILDTAWYSRIQGAYIALGSGTGTPSFTDYKLFSQVTLEQVEEPTIYHNTTHYEAYVSESFSIDTSFELTEVGLQLKYANKYILLTHDTVSPPMDLQAGDTVSIAYKFVFTKPFTLNLAEMITKLILSGHTQVSLKDTEDNNVTPDFEWESNT